MKQRKYQTAENKTKILQESMQEGCVIAALARKHDLSPDTLYRWRYDYFKKNQNTKNSNHFVEAKIHPDEPAKSQDCVANSLKKASLEFADFTISIEGAVDSKRLEHIIEVGSKC